MKVGESARLSLARTLPCSYSSRRMAQEGFDTLLGTSGSFSAAGIVCRYKWKSLLMEHYCCYDNAGRRALAHQLPVIG